MHKNNGSLYLGYFDHGRAHGRGAFIFENGSYYQGDFNNNRAESENGVYESDEVRYQGGFRNNKFDGKGAERGRNDSYIFEGTYNEGSRERGTLTWEDETGKYKYEGPFNQENQFHGKGTPQSTQALSKNPTEGTKATSSTARKKEKTESTSLTTAQDTKDLMPTANVTARALSSTVMTQSPTREK